MRSVHIEGFRNKLAEFAAVTSENFRCLVLFLLYFLWFSFFCWHGFLALSINFRLKFMNVGAVGVEKSLLYS